MPAIVVLTTVASAAQARKLASKLIHARVAACVSYREGFESCYRWKGRIERSRETVVMIKSHSKKYPKLAALLESKHPYDVPEILSLEVRNISTPYFKWLKDCVK